MINKYYSCLQILFHINYWITKFQQYLPQCLTSTSWAIFLRDELGSLCRRGTHPRNSNAANTKIQKHQTKNEPKKNLSFKNLHYHVLIALKKTKLFVISWFLVSRSLELSPFSLSIFFTEQCNSISSDFQRSKSNAMQFNSIFCFFFGFSARHAQ